MKLATQAVAIFAGRPMVSMVGRDGQAFWYLFDDEAEWELAKVNGLPLSTAVPAHEQVGALPREFREKLGLPVPFDVAAWIRGELPESGQAQRGADAGAGRHAGQSTGLR